MIKSECFFSIFFKSLLLALTFLTVNVYAYETRIDLRSHTGASCSSSKSLSRIKTGIRTNDNSGRYNNHNRPDWNERANKDQQLFLEVEIPFSFTMNGPSPSECLKILKQEERMRELDLEAKEHEIEMLRKQLIAQDKKLNSNVFVSN